MDLRQPIKPSSASCVIEPRQTRSTKESIVTYSGDNFVNELASKFFLKCLTDHPLIKEGVDSLKKKFCEKFIWYSPLEEIGSVYKSEKNATNNYNNVLQIQCYRI